eukprot:CAMPEP_0170555300 /NCGR_PEP_ID=MMETSP0211-20121228/13207_1 /TAXON_ID=311385 /ORGANISM="Pseudokeronopsis sp., Strain OXSARD2" /LENGTH=76 /DNA_ID=CAMNT_0010865061 /DNA_START=307 /DNA_END=537 /DNA_ORIENTATION=-
MAIITTAPMITAMIMAMLELSPVKRSVIVLFPPEPLSPSPSVVLLLEEVIDPADSLKVMSTVPTGVLVEGTTFMKV